VVVLVLLRAAVVVDTVIKVISFIYNSIYMRANLLLLLSKTTLNKQVKKKKEISSKQTLFNKNFPSSWLLRLRLLQLLVPPPLLS